MAFAHSITKVPSRARKTWIVNFLGFLFAENNNASQMDRLYQSERNYDGNA